MAIKESRMQQLHGNYEDLNPANLRVGEMAISSNHRPIAKADDNKIIEFLTQDDERDIDGLIQEVTELSERADKTLDEVEKVVIEKVGINDNIVSRVQTWSSDKIDYTFNKSVNASRAGGYKSLKLKNSIPDGQSGIIPGGIRINKITGQSYKWNQLFANNNFTETINGVTITSNNGIVNLSGTASANTTKRYGSVTVIQGHKYYISANKNSAETTYYMYCTTQFEEGWLTTTQGNEVRTAKTSGTMYFNIFVYGGFNCNNEKLIPQLIDLTAIFGEGEEPPIEIFEDWLEDIGRTGYQPYDVGSIHNTGEMGLVDMGSLNYIRYTNAKGLTYYRTSISGMKYAPSNATPFDDIVTEIATFSGRSANDAYNNQSTYGVYAIANVGIDFYIDGYATADAFKSAMSGVPLAFEPTDTYTGNRAIVVSECGKNLWDISAKTKVKNDGGNERDGFVIPIKQKGKYTIMSRNSSLRLFYGFTTSLATNPQSLGFLEQNTYSSQNINIADKGYLVIWYSGILTLDEGMIAYGENQVYTEYESNTVFIPITQPLCFADELVKMGGKWKEHRKCGIVDLGSLSWSISGNYYISSGIQGSVKAVDASTVANILSDRYTASNFSNVYNGSVDMAIAVVSDGRIAVRDTSLGTNNKPSGSLIYELATDTYTDCIDQVPFYELESYRNTTYIELDTYAYMLLTYGENEVVGIALANECKNGIIEAKLNKLLNPQATTLSVEE